MQNVEDSDIDIIVLIDEKDNDLKKYDDKVTDIMVDLSLEYELVVSILIESHETFQKHLSILPFFSNIKNEGVSIYEHLLRSHQCMHLP